MTELVELMRPYSLWIIVLGNVFLFLSLFLLVRAVMDGLSTSKKISEFVALSKNNEKMRHDEEQRRQLLEGATNEGTWLYRIDKKVAQSGLKEISPNITTEIVLISIVLFSSVLVLAGGLIAGTVGVIVGALIGIFIPYVGITYFSKKRYNQIEKQLLSFMNLIDNYSKTSDDIIEILGKIHHYLEPPLSNLLEECYAETKITGNSEQTLRELTDQIGHEKMKEIIENVEIASRHEADYSVIINDERELVSNYLYDKKEKQSLLRTARMETFVLMGIGALVVYMLSDGFGIPLSIVYSGNDILSQITIVVTAITFIFALKNLIFAK